VAVVRIQHMLTASETIAEYVARGRDAFDRDQSLRDAIVYQIIILGEAATAVIQADPSVESEVPDVDWSPLARMRDKVTHHYFGVDHEVVWSTAERDVPQIRTRLATALKRLT
jgi:uncharacterized protein with HEPN domain